ncbi:chemotaxis protein CheA [Rhodosalinus sp. FB01]|uniref:chemotaxis protein CheA n=1 Tax=Rhodosalinus sp. FB01 TaxID=3239194 RepID=UPI0035253E77
MSAEINPAIASFVQEARDLLEGLEGQLLDLEANADPERLDAVFRTLHTIKGSGAMFGFTDLSRFTHHFEEAFDQLRAGHLTVDPSLVDLCLRARDHMIGLLEAGADGDAADEPDTSPEAARLLEALARVTGETSKTSSPPAPTRHDAVATDRARRWHIRFRPDREALRQGMRPDLLIEELASLGALDVMLDTTAVPTLEAMPPEDSYLAWEVVLRTDRPRAEIEGVFIFADDATLEIEPLEEPSEAAPGASGTDARTRAEAPSASMSSPRADGPAQPVARPGQNRPADSLRVASAKLDRIMDQLGELVIAQSRLHKLAADVGHSELETVVETVERLVTGMREETLSIRMLPIEGVFGKFRRVVRDLAAELGKEVDLVATGGETELDKTVLDQLTEPLVHMIRNSMDHGFEPAEDRLAAGKPARGTLRLNARQEGGEVLITLEDDGGGLDTEAIRTRAVERGLLAPEAAPTEAELQQMIFAPGFSTAQTLSSVSGRGVGMDAVRSTIDGLNGGVEVTSSRGQGTRVTLRLPMTMAIMDGLLVRLGDSVLVVPLAVIDECVEMDPSDTLRDSGRRTLQIRDTLIPFVALDDALGLAADPDARRRVVVVRADGARLGLVVGDILGQNQTVIKPLSPYHRGISGLSGATILGDGSIALIIDVATLCRGLSRSTPVAPDAA